MTSLVVMLSSTCTSTTFAQREPMRLFPRRAPLSTPAEGLVRLPLDDSLLEGARPNLSAFASSPPTEARSPTSPIAARA